MEGSSGSVVLYQPHTSVNMELAGQKKATEIQRLEMADNASKRTRHPFSGYTEILFRERTIPVKKLKYRGPPKPYAMSRTMRDRDIIMGGAQDPPPNQPNAPREDPNRDQQILDMVDNAPRLRGFQPPTFDANTNEWVYRTLTAEGQEMFDRWLQFIGPQNARIFANHPNKVDAFHKYMQNMLEDNEDAYDQLLEILLGRAQNPRAQNDED